MKNTIYKQIAIINFIADYNYVSTRSKARRFDCSINIGTWEDGRTTVNYKIYFFRYNKPDQVRVSRDCEEN
jgi:hypothetical protein